jgi:Icc-related predicted phosphoesterase
MRSGVYRLRVGARSSPLAGLISPHRSRIPIRVPSPSEVRTDVRLAVIGDIHAHFARLDVVLARVAESRVDGILLVGDLGSHDLSYVRRRTPERDARYLASIEEVMRRVRAVGAPVLWVPGNHDLPDLAGDGNVDGSASEIAGLRVAGIGGAGPGRFGFSYEWKEDEIRRRTVPSCDVLLCHAPPARCALDRLWDRLRHVGSEALRERALAHDGVLVCGHIHESPGAVELGRCLCLNVGGLGDPHGRAQVGFVRRSEELAGAYEVVHEDLDRGRARVWQRSPA